MLQRCRDKALQNFHTLKIREINKIIRELWQLIYKGQDIDSIEIESGQEEGATATKSSRSYNYRVVMRKGESTTICLQLHLCTPVYAVTIADYLVAYWDALQVTSHWTCEGGAQRGRRCWPPSSSG
jgi:hypothetical protein